VYRNTSNASSGATQLATPTASPYNDTNAALGVIYYYFVKACNTAGCSDFSTSDSGYRAMSAPTGGVSATDGSYTDKVQVSWTASSGATSYQVYRNTSNASSGATLIATPTASPYNDTDATTGIIYYYFVKACGGEACSDFSASDSGFRSGVDAGGCQCSGMALGDVPVTVDCGQTTCKSDHLTYLCGTAGWSSTEEACGGSVDAGAGCQCNGTGPGGVPVTVDCGQTACGSDDTTYACSSAGWSWTGQVCGGNGDAGAGCQCSGTGPGDVPLTVDCGHSACGSDYTTYECSSAGWSWTGQACGGNGDAGAGCQCSGTGPGGVPLTVDCGHSACGSDYTTYDCSSAGWSWTGQACAGNGDAGAGCACSGTGPGGVPLAVDCGHSACGSDYVTYSCSASGWSWTGQVCGGNGDAGAGCVCSGTGPGGVPLTVDCGHSACGSDYVTYSCSASGWSWTGQVCSGN
jgi:hypothetical protein